MNSFQQGKIVFLPTCKTIGSDQQVSGFNSLFSDNELILETIGECENERLVQDLIYALKQVRQFLSELTIVCEP